jgi:hypothetical protein
VEKINARRAPQHRRVRSLGRSARIGDFVRRHIAPAQGVPGLVRAASKAAKRNLAGSSASDPLLGHVPNDQSIKAIAEIV